jgi:serpin B
LTSLINTIYFKSEWLNVFDLPGKNDVFTNKDGTPAETYFMHSIDHYNYYENGDFQMLEMKYYGADMSMLLFLPRTVGGQIGAEQMSLALSQRKPALVNVKLPKFKAESKRIDLIEMMRALGVHDAFREDCQGFNDTMVENCGMALSILSATQSVSIEVNEEGTEATAETIIAVGPAGSGGTEPVIMQFHAARPFTYLIRDNTNETVLFIGEYRFANPAFQ